MTLSLWTIGGFIFAACCFLDMREGHSQENTISGLVVLLITCAGCCQ